MEILASLILNGLITWWVSLDAARRGRRWVGWAALTWITGIVGLGIWLLVRRRHPLAREPLSRKRRAAIVVASLPLAILAVVTNFLIVTFVVQVGRMEGMSMAPTLEAQDRVIINKLAYRLPNHVPHAGDVVMFLYPADPTESFVKRIIGEPGDILRSVAGRLYRNDIEVPSDNIPEDFRSYETWGPEVVRDGHYFVMGDRRNNSSDSRTWGTVPRNYILGRVALHISGDRFGQSVR